MSDRLRSYDVARKTFSFLEFIGWGVVVLGIIAGFIMAGSAGRYAGDGQKFLLFLLGASSSLIGLFMVGAVQNWRAGVDAAEYGQQALRVAREQLEISKQGLASSKTSPESFADRASAGEEPAKSYANSTSHETTPEAVDELKALFSEGAGRGEYKGIEMRKEGNLILVADQSFLTLERAKQYIEEDLT